VTVALNEWMAANVHTLQDPLDKNAYNNWFELYNYGGNPMDLAGCYLSDTLADPYHFQVPPGYTIPARAHLLVWADNKAAPGDSDLHVNFKLRRDGAALILCDPRGDLLDYVEYGPQLEDVSQGRIPDGASTIYALIVPTPRSANCWTNSPPVLAPINPQVLILGQCLTLQPEATDPDAPPQTLEFSLGPETPPGASIDPTSGQFNWIPATAPSTNTLTLIATDDAVPGLAASQTFTVVVIPPPALAGTVADDGNLLLDWKTLSGQLYQLEYADTIEPAAWVPFGYPIVGNGQPITLSLLPNSLPENSASLFFRLRILP